MCGIELINVVRNKIKNGEFFVALCDRAFRDKSNEPFPEFYYDFFAIEI